MVKRTKRLEKGIESIKEEIEEHFLKLSEDIINKNKYLAGYHTKEIELSFNNDFARWFFEEHLAESADNWEQKEKPIEEIDPSIKITK